MSDEVQRRLDNLARLREASQTAAAELDEDEATRPALAADIAALAPQAPKSLYVMGDSATREWKALARAEFDALREAHRRHPHREKMVSTIVALVDARLAGNPETPVFGRKDTCSANIYHTKWKHDPAFATCLDNVTKLAREWKDGRALRALEEAAEKLALASPGAAAKLTDAMVHAGDWNVMVRAAVAILDRAGVQTAVKQGGELLAFLNKLMERLDIDKLSPQQVDRIVGGEHPLVVILGDYLADS